MINQISERIAISINKNASNPSSVNVLKYALSVFIKLVIMFSTVMVFAIITGHAVDGIAAFCSFATLRYFSGGLHLRSEKACNIISTIMVLLSIYTTLDYWYNGLVLNGLALILILAFAPSNMKKSRLSPKYYPYLKVIAALIIIANFSIKSSVIATAFFLQAFTVIPNIQQYLSRKNL